MIRCKMDQPGTDRERLLQELKEKLDDRCVDYIPWLQIPQDIFDLSQSAPVPQAIPPHPPRGFSLRF